MELKSHPELLTLLSSLSGYCEAMRTVGPLWALQGETRGAGKAQPPRHQIERGHSLHTGTKQPQLQLHPKPLQSHLSVEEEI